MEDDNVIYVQVDEQGRVINYTSNTSISDQFILLQEDGKDGQMGVSTLAQGTSSVQSSPLTQTVSSPRFISPATPKSPMLNLSSLPSGVKLVGATPPGTQIQTSSGVRIAAKPITNTPLSPVMKQVPTSTVITASPERVTINPQKITINPQKITLSPQPIRTNIAPQTLAVSPQKILNPGQKIGKVSILSTGPSDGPISAPQVKSSVVGMQSIITPDGVKQVSLLGPVQRQPTNITIKAQGATTGLEQISLDQLMSSGGVTLQRLPVSAPTQGLNNAEDTSTINSTTVGDAILNITQQPVIDPFSQHEIPVLSARTDDVSKAAQEEAVAYAKPDTTTDEETLLSYQHSTEMATPLVSEAMETGELSTGAQALTSVPEHVLKEDSLMNVMIPDNEPAQILNVGKPVPNEAQEERSQSLLTNTDEMKETNTCDDLMDFLTDSNKPTSDTDALQNKREIIESKSENESFRQSEGEDEDEFRELPAGLIRGEPVQMTSSSKVTSTEYTDNVETDDNDELVPAEVTSHNARKNRLPLAVQSEPSESDESDSEISKTDKEYSDQEHSSKPRMRGRPRKQKAGTPEAPEVSEKKDFMKKNFNLFTPRELEEQRNKRRSARISNAEMLQQAEAELEKEEKSSDAEKSSTHKEYEDSSRQNIFDIMGTEKEGTPSSENTRKHISKLQSVNTELKVRIRQLESKLGKSPQAKYKEKTQMKMLQVKLERSERLNEELLRKLAEYEGKDSQGKSSPPEQKFDMTRLKHGRLSFTPGSSKRDSYRFDLSSSSASEKQESATLRKKEQRVKALHHEIDFRTGILRAKESKLQRMVTEIKERENKVAYREQALTRRVQDIEYRERILEGKTKAAIEKRNKQGGASVQDEGDDIRSKELLRFEIEQRERELKRREDDLQLREEEAKNKEQLLKVTEQELHELHIEIKQEYEKSTDSSKQGEFLDTPRSAYLSKVGATPQSGRSTRPLRHVSDARKSITPVKTSSIKSNEILAERKRRSMAEEKTLRPSRGEISSDVTLQPSHDSKQDEIVPQERLSVGHGRLRKTARHEDSRESSESTIDTTIKARPTRGALKIAQPEESTESVTPDISFDTPSSNRRGRGRPKKIKPNEEPNGQNEPSETVTETKTGQVDENESEQMETESGQITGTEPETESDVGKDNGSRVATTERRGRGRPRKSEVKEPEVTKEELGTKEEQQADTEIISTSERRGRGRQRKSAAELPTSKTVTEENTSADESSSTEPPPQLTKELLPKDDYDFEGSSQSESEQEPVVLGTITRHRAPTPLSGTKAQDLKQGLKSLKKPRGVTAMPVLRKRSRSHSASPAPSEGKKQKND